MIVKFDLGDIEFEVNTDTRQITLTCGAPQPIIDLSDLTEAYLGILKVCVPEGVGTPPAHTAPSRAADRPSPDIPRGEKEPDAIDL